MAAIDQPTVINEAISTGVIRIELLGDKGVARTHTHEARKLTAQLRAMYGVTERIANGDQGGFYQHIVELKDGSTMIASTNNGYDTVKILGVGVTPEDIKVVEVSPIVPTEQVELGVVVDLLVSIRPRGLIDQDIYRFVVADNSLELLAAGMKAQGGIASGYTTYMLVSITGEVVLHSKTWEVIANLSVGTGVFDRFQCVFSQGQYYVQSEGVVTRYNEKGDALGSFSADLSFDVLNGMSGRPGGGMCIFEFRSFDVRNAKGGVVGAGADETMVNSAYTAFANLNQIAASDTAVYVPRDLLITNPRSLDAPFLAKWSNNGELLGVDSTFSRDARNARRGMGVMTFANSKLYVVDERSANIVNGRTSEHDTMLQIYSEDLVLETTIEHVFANIPTSLPGQSVPAFDIVPDYTPKSLLIERANQVDIL